MVCCLFFLSSSFGVGRCVLWFDGVELEGGDKVMFFLGIMVDGMRYANLVVAYPNMQVRVYPDMSQTHRVALRQNPRLRTRSYLMLIAAAQSVMADALAIETALKIAVPIALFRPRRMEGVHVSLEQDPLVRSLDILLVAMSTIAMIKRRNYFDGTFKANGCCSQSTAIAS
jgi:hypothetical protein